MPRVVNHLRATLLLWGLCLMPAISSAQSLIVLVREQSGEPLSSEAVVRVTSRASTVVLVGMTGDAREAAGASSFDLPVGDYEIEVEAAGYKKGTEQATVPPGRVTMVYVYLPRAGSTAASNAPAGGIVLAPKVQREVDQGLAAMRRNKLAEARKHLETAHKMAPSIPDILYLLGVVEYMEKDLPAARKQFEAVLAANPTHARSLVMLGQMQLDAGENSEASATLLKAVEADSNNWRPHYLLALALLRTKELPKAELEAARAGELSKEKTAAMMLLRAKILMLQGKNTEAKPVLQTFLKDYPSDPGAPEAKKYVDRIEQWQKSTATDQVIGASEPPRPAGKEAIEGAVTALAWAPPDVDAAIPHTATGVSCSLDEILNKTQQRVLEQVGGLEEFSATERVEHQVLDSKGAWTLPVAREFNYLIFVHRTKTIPYSFDEDRNGGESLYSFPTSLATLGLATLGFMVVNPVYAKDFQFVCEGLGSWEGQPAWQLHFVQRSEAPSHLRLWNYHGNSYRIPIKGRIWIAANSYNILHLETALREPVSGLELKREQVAVDYGPVRFQSAKTELWLPNQADMYFELAKRRYHHKHTLSKYMLFDVDTKDQIKLPPLPPEPKEN